VVVVLGSFSFLLKESIVSTRASGSSAARGFVGFVAFDCFDSDVIVGGMCWSYFAIVVNKK